MVIIMIIIINIVNTTVIIPAKHQTYLQEDRGHLQRLSGLAVLAIDTFMFVFIRSGCEPEFAHTIYAAFGFDRSYFIVKDLHQLEEVSDAVFCFVCPLAARCALACSSCPASTASSD
jgi:hypothetical protein